MSAETEGRGAAERFRREHRLGLQPLGDLVAIVEQTAGIDVAVLDAGPDEHGLTMRDPKHNTVIIGVARTRDPMRQRSTLAHELGHVQFGDWTESTPGKRGGRSRAEVRADAFARHLLLPIDGLREFLGTGKPATHATLSSVVQRFLVSPAIAAIALQQVGYLDAATKDSWMVLSTRRLAVGFGWSDQYEALRIDSDRRRAPQRLLARAINGYVEGVLSAQAIATLRGIPLETVEAELREAGITPAERPVVWADPSESPNVEIDWAALDQDLNAPDVAAESRTEAAGR
ncbi:ImmA/IrrE family metallo-endopeptidase [Winogradskya humida]|uniref:IrrE N-terminal-like domain-containing protein n=1 Tax=Winogradskya humida TaxID=113566 RepID=A0ABQ3ZGR2_9ACTN|nr:ImmA/IrrE family metallo-endopeptidase [Actinoplanes humidus]GIE17760.1 hypothetical protein Ahu01nite_008620 [Actinoplanes humidus]